MCTVPPMSCDCTSAQPHVKLFWGAFTEYPLAGRARSTCLQEVCSSVAQVEKCLELLGFHGYRVSELLSK